MHFCIFDKETYILPTQNRNLKHGGFLFKGVLSYEDIDIDERGIVGGVSFIKPSEREFFIEEKATMLIFPETL